MVYSIGYFEKNRPYKFFGGTPENITKNLKKITFNNKAENISKIEVIFQNGKNFTINIEEENKRFRFDEESGNMIRLPRNIYNIFYSKLFKDYKYKEKEIWQGIYHRYDAFELNEEQIENFPNILFTIGNKVLILNKKNAIMTENNYLLIDKLDNNNDFYFGQKFFDLFEITEFDLHSGDVNLYSDKNKNYIYVREDNKKDIIKSNFDFIVIIVFIILISMAMTIFKNYYKNKKIEYYNQYYDI